MPIQPTFPGVYVQELPSSVHPITGVATSITAFIGRALRGPVNVPTTTNVPTTIFSFGDFQRIFGGLWVKSALGYAVQDFFNNGGSQAIIVRLFNPDMDNSNPPKPINTRTLLTFSGLAGLILEAASEGAWGNNLSIAINYSVPQPRADGTYDPNDATVTPNYNFTITEIVNGQTTRSEQFNNMTIVDGPRRIDKVLKNGSQLVRVSPDNSNPSPPNPFPVALITAANALMQPIITAQNTLTTDQQATPPVQAKITADLAALKGAIKTLTQTTHTQTIKPADIATDGQALIVDRFLSDGDKTGIRALDNADLFNILCIPPYNDLVTGGGPADIDLGLLSAAAKYCVQRRAMLLIDPPTAWQSAAQAVSGIQDITLAIGNTNNSNAAIYFPMLQEADILHNNQIGMFVPCGAIAGVFASTDTQRGVWKAPAGTQASIGGVAGLGVPLTNDENGELNPLGVNCLRIFPATGAVVWGARTLQGNDALTSQWKYVPVRRTALFLEESLYRGLQWVVFEPNDEPLWAQIRLNVTSFMQDLFRKGAFQGSTPQQAYLVKCDKETTTQTDIDNGIVNILVGFAPLKPAEFVILQIEQLAGQTQA